ncbi:MAG: DUF3883 domain-containing protein [Gammaproteobacteria bacterium]|nr:DUF3883 domain-containing protein [Gammaproteobacteria bacterium]
MRSHRPPRLPSSRFEGLTAEDVVAAIVRYNAGETHNFGDSTRYDLVSYGVRYPPKAIFGLAAERVLRRKLTPADFAGGLGSICFRTLAKLGYSVVAKSAIEDLPEEDAEIAVGVLLEVQAAERHQECPLASKGKRDGAPRIGGRRLSRRAKELGDRAEECVFKQLAAEQATGRIAGLRWLAREGQTPGWDIEYQELPSRAIKRIEVKGALAKSIGAFDLTANELKAALEFGPDFGLALVTESGSARPKVFYLWNVARSFAENRLVREPLVWGVRSGPAAD